MDNNNKRMDEGVGGGPKSLAGRYLAFKIDGGFYAIEILGIREIIGLTTIAPLPKAPKCVRGVINLRGRVIPVIYLRSCFGMESVEPTERTSIIILNIERWGKTFTVGVVVDEVTEVLDIEEGATEPAPEFGTGAAADFIKGVGKVGDRIVLILDANKLLPGGEMDDLNQLT